jgi:hypothetical protein
VASRINKSKVPAHLRFEAAYWGDCLNTHDEDTKQLVYAQHMNLNLGHHRVELDGQRVLDVGSGPSSLLLKATGRGRFCAVLDPLMDHFPRWVRDRYETADIVTLSQTAEWSTTAAAPAGACGSSSGSTSRPTRATPTC